MTAELRALYASFQECLDLRDRYLALSRQRLEDNPANYDGEFNPAPDSTTPSSSYPTSSDSVPPSSPRFPKWNIYPAPPKPHWDPNDPNKAPPKPESPGDTSKRFRFSECEIPKKHEWSFKIDRTGVYQVYASDDSCGSKC
jgi:AMP deaminase